MTCLRCQETGVLVPHLRERLPNGERLFWCDCPAGVRQRRRRDLWVSFVWATLLAVIIAAAWRGC